MHLKICKLDAEDEVVAELVVGSHIVGRGPILKCSDKRISRNHATINVQMDQATITPIHVNPCYHMAADSKTVRILPHQKDASLQDGDKFGLLPDACWFKVKYEPDGNCEEFQNGSPMKRLCEDGNDEKDCKRLKLEETLTASGLRQEPVYQSNVEEKTDKEQVVIDSVEIKSENECSKEVAKQNSEVAENIDFTEANEVKEENIDISDGNELTEISEVKEEKIDIFENGVEEENSVDCKVNHNTERDEMKQENDVANEVKQDNTDEAEMKQEDNVANEVKQDDTDEAELKQENIQGNAVGSGNENLDPQPSTSSSNQEPKDEGKKEKDTKDQATGTASPKMKREKCWYGASCYRKNPAHRADLRHPGDSDYLSDSEDERPTCIFGAQCYRKNKLHRQSYKHPPRQRPQNYGRGQRRRANRNPANPNDDFISSDEDDMLGDFSDGSSDNYEPPSEIDSDETDWTSSQDINSQDLRNID